jgi:hypothetical protein
VVHFVCCTACSEMSLNSDLLSRLTQMTKIRT